MYALQSEWPQCSFLYTVLYQRGRTITTNAATARETAPSTHSDYCFFALMIFKMGHGWLKPVWTRNNPQRSWSHWNSIWDNPNITGFHPHPPCIHYFTQIHCTAVKSSLGMNMSVYFNNYTSFELDQIRTPPHPPPPFHSDIALTMEEACSN